MSEEFSKRLSAMQNRVNKILKEKEELKEKVRRDSDNLKKMEEKNIEIKQIREEGNQLSIKIMNLGKEQKKILKN